MPPICQLQVGQVAVNLLVGCFDGGGAHFQRVVFTKIEGRQHFSEERQLRSVAALTGAVEQWELRAEFVERAAADLKEMSCRKQGLNHDTVAAAFAADVRVQRTRTCDEG